MSQTPVTEPPPLPPSQPVVYPWRSLRHRMLGKLLELVITRLSIAIQSEFQMMSEPPKADLLLLRHKGKVWTEEQRAALPDGIRDRHARHHLLECKFSESVNEAAIQQALGYDSLYRRTQRLKPQEVQTYVVSAKTPDAAFLARLGYQPGEAAGVYVTSTPIVERIVLLVLNELSNEPHNECFRLFASRQRVRKETLTTVGQRHVTDWSEEIWAVVFGLQSIYELEESAMNQEVTIEDVMKLGSRLRKQVLASVTVKDLDENVRKQVIASADPKERLAGISPEERLAGISPEERLAGISPKERLAGISPDEMSVLLEQIEAMLRQQPTKQKPKRTRNHKRST